MYCKFGNFRENFIFANSVKRHICNNKSSRLGHDLPISYIIYMTIYIIFNLCRLLMIFANSLDPDQARRSAWPGLDLKCLVVLYYS